MEKVVRTICPYCGVGCGLAVKIRDGRIVDVKGDKSHPSSLGGICPKGAQIDEIIATPNRLTTAQIRSNRADPFQPASLDDALSHVAVEFRDIIRTHGADAVAFYISGQLSTEAQYVFNKLAKGFIGTNNVDANSRLCMASAASAYKLAFGSDGPPTCYDDIEQAECFLIVGANMAECHPVLWQRVKRRASRKRVRIIVVDPRRTPTAEGANLHLAIAPGTDIALLNGILHVMITQGWINERFIRAHTENWERLKRELHPLDAYSQIVENAINNKAPEREDMFRFKWNGLFFLTPVKDAFMARLRIPGGVVTTPQLREIARVAQDLTTGYVQITTRANFQIRLIKPKDAPEVLRRIQSVGLHTRGAGADNIRNLTGNPTAGIDPVELIDVLPLINELAQIIINDRSFYDLPRKFNIAYDGGGLIGSVEDTNDVGVKAVKLNEQVFFRIALGGATGHKSFAQDLGVVVPPSEINKVVVAIVRVYIERGCRADRKKARLKHLLEKMSLPEYLAEVENKLGAKLRRAPYDPAQTRWAAQELPHSHIGDFPQKQRGLNYVGVALPVGQITPKQMLRVAELADSYGSGEIRLTVWQNFIIPNVSDAFVATLKRALQKAGLGTQQSNVAGGVIACTGNSYCKFAQSNTKGHALELIRYLEHRVELDQPVNIHLTGCPNSCAQHYMGDIGCLGAKTKIGGESLDGYHIFVGGGFGKNQAVGRQVFAGVTASELPRTLENMLRAYLRHRRGRESFRQFTNRMDVGRLQELFGSKI